MKLNLIQIASAFENVIESIRFGFCFEDDENHLFVKTKIELQLAFTNSCTASSEATERKGIVKVP